MFTDTMPSGLVSYAPPPLPLPTTSCKRRATCAGIPPPSYIHSLYLLSGVVGDYLFQDEASDYLLKLQPDAALSDMSKWLPFRAGHCSLLTRRMSHMTYISD